MTDSNWLRYRFHADGEDFRPVYDPEKGTPGLGPYWCTGYGDDYSIVVAYLRPGVHPTVYWPEASHTDDYTEGPIKFSDRFPEPDWWKTRSEYVVN